MAGIGRDNEKGAITVFLAIVFMSAVLIAGMAIDISRIIAAENKVQGALDSSARSVMAEYDGELVGSYGLYGLDTASDGIGDEFYKYISVNLKERHQGIRLLDIDVDRKDVEIYGMNSLLKDDAFRSQIQEYMKYRTMINASESLVEQLKNIRLDKKVEFAEAERSTRVKAKELRMKANAVNSKLKSIGKKLAGLSAEKLEDLKKELMEALELGGEISTDDGRGLLEDYNTSITDSKDKAEEGGCVENQSQEFQGIREESTKLTPALQVCLTEVNKTIRSVAPMQSEMEELEADIEDLEGELSELEEKLSDLEDEDDDSSDKEDRLEEKMGDIEEELDEAKDEKKQLQEQIAEELSALKDRLIGIRLEGFTLKKESAELSLPGVEEFRNKISGIREEIEASLLKSLKAEWLIKAEEFETASMVDGESFEIMYENAIYNPDISEKKAEESNDSILEGMERLSKTIEAVASNAAGKISTIEYVMENFSFLTSKTERNHYFKKGEVEYIICGNDTSKTVAGVRNSEYYLVTNVFLQVWALRFAMDTLDDFARSAVVFPPQRLAFSLAEGALDSSMEMVKMMDGEGVPILPKSLTGIRLKYSDHLRLLLLMKPEEEILRKTRQLIQVNIKQMVDKKTGMERTDFRLGAYSTVISASVEARVNLLFLPMLKLDKLMPGSFEEGRYIIRKKIYMGY